MGEYKQAVDSYSEVIRLEPNHLQAYRDRADAYEKIGDKSKAKTDRQKADEMEKQQNSP
jgi:Flp pilus assembly protein TadD